MTPEQVMKRCQIGCHRLDDANDLLAECYGTIGKLLNEKATQDERVVSDLVLDGGEISSGLFQDFQNMTHGFNVRHKNGDEFRVTIKISEI